MWDWIGLFQLPTNNPLFVYGLQRVRGIKSIGGLRGYTRRMLWLLLILAFLAVLLAFDILNSVNSYYGQDSPDIVEVFSVVGGGVVYVAVLTIFIPDIAVLLSSSGLINRERSHGRYDLARLSLGVERVVTGQHAVGVVQGWRGASIWVLARLVGVLFLFTSIAVELFEAGNGFNLIYGDVVLTFFAVIVWGGMGVVGGCFFLMEPFWRLRLSVAIGIFTSARTKNMGMATLYAIGLGAAVYGGLILCLVMIYFIVSYTIFFYWQYTRRPFVINELIVPLLFVVLFVGFTYIFYRQTRRVLLNRTVTYLQQRD